jgi:hypothetical protein
MQTLQPIFKQAWHDSGMSGDPLVSAWPSLPWQSAAKIQRRTADLALVSWQISCAQRVDVRMHKRMLEE